MAKENSKVPRLEGQERLKSAGFHFRMPCGQAELWVNKNKHPALISYSGRDPNYFDAASLEAALEIKDEDF